MGMTNIQKELVRYVAENNLQKAKLAALGCCREDTTQKNTAFVKRYTNLLQNTGMNLLELPLNISGFAKAEDLALTYREDRYYLSEEEKAIFERIRDMYKVSQTLMEKQIPYLNATLLYGESGVGKTEFSRYVAYKLGIPYLYVDFSRMMDSYLGKSAQNLGHLFDYIKQQQCVVMLDELDSLAIKRKYQDGGASAEIARTTTCLLQLLDSVTNDHIILAATNLQDSIDPAVKRRFTEKHEIRRLSKDDRRSFIIQFLTATDFSYDLQSSAKKSWYGMYNYLVITKELADKVEDWDKFLSKEIGILVLMQYASHPELYSIRKAKRESVTPEMKNILQESLIRTLYNKMEKYRSIADGRVEAKLKKELSELQKSYKREKKLELRYCEEYMRLRSYVRRYKNKTGIDITKAEED